jgi:hypothetical protein
MFTTNSEALCGDASVPKSPIKPALTPSLKSADNTSPQSFREWQANYFGFHKQHIEYTEYKA